MRFHVLGGLAVTDEDQPLDLGTPKQRAIVAVLLLERDQVVSADRLIELLWDDDADKAIVSLRTYVSRLRTILEPGRRPRDPARVLVSQAPGYRLVVPREDVDLHRFEDAVAAGRRRLREGDRPGAVEALEGALEIWTGPVLPELATEPFVMAVAARAAEVRLGAVEALGEAWLDLGDPHEAVGRLEPVASANPTRERLQGLLALALYRCERQADALRVVARCRQALLEDHGLDMGADLKRLEADLLAQSPALDLTPDLAPTTAATATSPRADPLVAPTGRGEPSRAAPIVGREHELALLHGALAEAAAGHGSIAVVVGEPGIGKSRLAEAAVERARADGFATVWARCPESRSTPPFWTLTQISQQLSDQLPTWTVDGVELPAPAGPSDAGTGTGPDTTSTARTGFELYRASLTQVLAVDHPILVVVDDLQWADPDSLRLLEHIAADLGTTRLLLVVTMRPLDAEASDALVDCLAEIARLPASRYLEVSGLRAEEVVDWLTARGDVRAPDEVAAVVHERTAGNPLFVKELTELLASEGRLDDAVAVADAQAIPPGVRFVVRRRVSRLPRSSQQLLSTAAVLGSPFRLDTLAAVVETTAASVLADLAPALDEGLLVESRGELAFSHALVGDALASEINAARRAAIHAGAAQALAAAAGPTLGTDAAVVAHHAMEGMLAGSGDLAVEASRRAAELAESRLAHEDAADHWGNAATALARTRPGDTAARIDAMISEGAALVRADRTEAAKEPILGAIEAADAIGLVDAMVRAASLVNHTHVWTNEGYGMVDPRMVEAIERALAALGDGDLARRAVLLGALASELVFAEPARHQAACDEAERVARASGDPVVLAGILNIAMLPNRPALLDERRRSADEMVALATAHPLPAELVYAAHYHVAEAHLEVGDLAGVTAEMAIGRSVLEEIPRSHLHAQQMWAEAGMAVAAGRHDEAQLLVNRAHELHRRGRFYDTDTILLTGIAAIAIDHGGLEDLVPFALSTVGETTYERVACEAIAFAMLEVGRADLARSLTAPYGPDAEFVDDYTTLVGFCAALHVRVELDDPEGAAAVAARLEPYADRWTSPGMSPLSMGPTALALARQRAAAGEADEAERLFAAAVAMTEANGAVGWRARSLVHQATFLADQGDAAAARQARAEARALAERIGLPYVLRRLDATES